MNVSDYNFPSPKFIIFHYFIKWFIDNFGIIPYFIFIVGSVLTFCMYALRNSFKRNEFDKIVMISIFTLIIIGGLVGLGYDINNGHPITFQ